MEKVSFHTADGARLGGELHLPARQSRGVVVIASAMAVRHKLYRYLAQHLATRGLAALTFDYRGIDESLHSDLRALKHVSAEDWGVRDLGAAFRFAAAQVPGVPLLHLGHSLGGQLLGLCPEAALVKASVLIASQSGYWKHWAGRRRALMRLNWLLMPTVARLVGYLPMQQLRRGENVPLGVALDWARWGRHPDYVLSSPLAHGPHGHGRLTLPMRAYLVSDDPDAPRAAVEALLRMYSGATVELREITPGQLGTTSIGHFGLFRREFEANFWEEVAAWFSSAIESG